MSCCIKAYDIQHIDFVNKEIGLFSTRDYIHISHTFSSTTNYPDVGDIKFYWSIDTVTNCTVGQAKKRTFDQLQLFTQQDEFTTEMYIRNHNIIDDKSLFKNIPSDKWTKQVQVFIDTLVNFWKFCTDQNQDLILLADNQKRPDFKTLYYLCDQNKQTFSFLTEDQDIVENYFDYSYYLDHQQ